MLSFASPDGLQMETVQVSLSGRAMRATGYLVCARERAYGASYSVVVDNEGRSRRITVRCDDASGERSLSLTRSPDGPWIAETVAGSVPHPELADATDVYLDGSPFTASLPVRRLGLQEETGRSGSVTVASISLPELELSPIQHSGTTTAVDADGAWITYVGSYGERAVRVDSDGLFVSADGLRHRLG